MNNKETGITLVMKDDKTCPAIICNTCGKRITDFREGNYVWNNGKESDFKFVHKGECDDKYKYSMEIEHFIVYLLHNLKFKTEDLKRANLNVQVMDDMK